MPVIDGEDKMLGSAIVDDGIDAIVPGNIATSAGFQRHARRPPLAGA